MRKPYNLNLRNSFFWGLYCPYAKEIYCVLVSLPLEKTKNRGQADWLVVQKNVYAEDGAQIPGYRVNVRNTDSTPLGIVSDHYKVVQNEDAFQFTDDLLGEGVALRTAGACRVATRSGFWLECLSATSSPETRSSPIWWS